MLFSKPSGDIKYNKIKEIEQEIHCYVAYCYSSFCDKALKKEVWILANDIYNISVAGLEDKYEYECDEDDSSAFPIHWSKVISIINRNSIVFKCPPYLMDLFIRQRWLYYDYVNS